VPPPPKSWPLARHGRLGQHEIVGAETGQVDAQHRQRAAVAEIDDRIATDLVGASEDIAEAVDLDHGPEIDAVDGSGPRHEVGDGVGPALRTELEDVVALAADQRVGTGAAIERVVPGATIQQVVSAEAVKDVPLVGGNAARRCEPEDVAVEVDEIEIADGVLAERRDVVHRAEVLADLRGPIGGDPRGAVEAQGEHLPLHEVGEEILPLQELRLAAIDVAAGDRLAHAVAVEVNGRDRRSARRRAAGEDIRSLEHVPAVVGTDLAEVDLLPLVRADVGDVEVAKPAIEAVAPRVAQAERKYLIGAGRRRERIVGWHRIVARRVAGKGVAIHVDPQDLAEQGVEILPVGGWGAVAGRDIEIPIGPKTDPAGLVVLVEGLIDSDDWRDARRVGDVRVRRHLIAADFGVSVGIIDEVDVEKAVAGEVRIEGKAEQAALAVRKNLARHVEERRRQHLSGGEIEDFDQAGLLHDEKATGIAGRRTRENRLPETGRDPGRKNCAGFALSSVRIVPIDEISTRGAVEVVAGIVAYDEIDVRHWNPRRRSISLSERAYVAPTITPDPARLFRFLPAKTEPRRRGAHAGRVIQIDTDVGSNIEKAPLRRLEDCTKGPII
jgi:hypothetical protein